MYPHSWPLPTSFASHIFFKSHIYTSEIPVIIQQTQAVLRSPLPNTVSLKNAQLLSFHLSSEVEGLNHTFAVQLWVPLNLLLKWRMSLQRAPVCSPSSFGAGPQTCHLIAVCFTSPLRKSNPPHTAWLQSTHTSEWGLWLTMNLSNNDSVGLIWDGTWRHFFNTSK